MGTSIKIILVEVYNSIRVIKQYYAPIRRAYEIIIAKIQTIKKDLALQIAFKAVNNLVGLNGLVLTLLVYGAYPRIIEYNPSLPIIIQRAIAIRKAIVEVQRIRAKRIVNNALNIYNRPRIILVYNLNLNSNVLVFRENNTSQLEH